MPMTRVYDYYIRHAGMEELVCGPYMATREAIEEMDAKIVEASEREVEDALVTDGKVMRDTVVNYGTGLG